MRRKQAVLLVVALLALVATLPAFAADIEKKWRIGLSAGFLNSVHSIDSDSANVMVLRRLDLTTEAVFVDPRNDSAVFGQLDLDSGPIGVFSVQYAPSKIFVIEGSVGYQKTDFQAIEMQAQFRGVDVPITDFFAFSIFRIPAGELERIPVQFTGLVRFRPRASFNPYVGAGLGYEFIGFEPSEELNQLSLNMDSSIGAQTTLTEATFGTPQIRSNFGARRDLDGARIDAGDSFEWHLVVGAEYTFKKKWSAYLDIRHSFSSRSIGISFNDSGDLGIRVPNLTDFVTSPLAEQQMGPVEIDSGGLIDGGSFQPTNPSDPDPPDCAATPTPPGCTFVVGLPDGKRDPGFYYVQGGNMNLDAFTLQLGIRYTF